MHPTGSPRSGPAWQADDLELVRRAAHTLKANGLTFGAQVFASRLCGARAHGEARELGAATTLATEVERTWVEARPAIEALRA